MSGSKSKLSLLLLLFPFFMVAHGVSSGDQEILNSGGLLS